jgi:hypothetical protein
MPKKTGRRVAGSSPAMTGRETDALSAETGVTSPHQRSVIETSRLILRQWRSADIAPYTAMLADPLPRGSSPSMASRCWMK